MTNQISFDFSSALVTGQDLAEQGMQTAEDHANKLQPKWSDDALNILREFISKYDIDFMTEDLRRYAEKERGFTAPASSRAWGGVISRAKKSGLIKFVGIRAVGNPKAHAANAAIWKANNNEP